MALNSVIARGIAGTLFGAVLMYGALVGATLYPNSVPARSDVTLPQAADRSEVTISFITTARSSTPGFRIAQGLGLARREVAFRAAVIHHPEGVVVFGAGLSSANPAPSLAWNVWNPFGQPTIDRSAARVLADAGIEPSLVVLPTLRWYNASGAAEFDADVQIGTSSSERWAAFDGTWPHRYMIDTRLLEPIRERVQTFSWGRRAAFGRTRTYDVFGDETIVLTSLRGSLQDEVGAIVTLRDGQQVVLVGDAVWSDEQVRRRLPRTLWANFAHDRNRMQLASLIAEMNVAEERGVDVIPLLDGELDLPEFPATLP